MPVHLSIYQSSFAKNITRPAILLRNSKYQAELAISNWTKTRRRPRDIVIAIIKARCFPEIGNMLISLTLSAFFQPNIFRNPLSCLTISEDKYFYGVHGDFFPIIGWVCSIYRKLIKRPLNLKIPLLNSPIIYSLYISTCIEIVNQSHRPGGFLQQLCCQWRSKDFKNPSANVSHLPFQVGWTWSNELIQSTWTVLIIGAYFGIYLVWPNSQLIMSNSLKLILWNFLNCHPQRFVRVTEEKNALSMENTL